AIIGCIRVADAKFGGDDRILAATAQRLGQRPLRCSHSVCLGGVETVDTKIERAVDRFDEFGFLDTAVAAADFPATDPDGGDLKAGLAEWTIFHSASSFSGCWPNATTTAAIAGRSEG